MAVAPAIFTVPRWSLPIPPLDRLPTCGVRMIGFADILSMPPPKNSRRKRPLTFSVATYCRRECPGMLAISCNGKKPGTAIVWALHPTSGNANSQTVAGTLQAFKADDLRQALWTSNHDPRGNDDLGDFAKFCTPVIANGKVYVATFSQQLVVYGLLSEGQASSLGSWSQEDIPLQSSDNRTFQVEGTASLSCQRFTILGAGVDIWGVSDAFHYVYQNITTESLTLTARIVSILRTDEWAKAGIMIRASLDADSTHAMMAITPDHGAAFQYRPAKGAQSIHVPFASMIQAPYWVRLVRTALGGSFQFTGLVSVNGADWVEVGSTSPIDMPIPALAGMSVTAHADPPHDNRLQDLCTAVIDKVTLAT